MFDLHAHILPETDDGARSEAEALAMARAASSSGTQVMVATPHMKDVNELSSPRAAASLCAALGETLEEMDCPLRLVMGMENHVVPELVAMFRDGRALPIGESRYALVEMPFFGHPDYLEPTLNGVRSLGLTPVLAHPERIEAVQRDPELLTGFIEAGMLSQVTAGSLIGHFGEDVRRFTENLVRNGLAHVISSDCHRPSGPRSPDLTAGLAAAVDLVGKAAARRMVDEIPRAITEDGPVDADTPGSIEPMTWR